jgi:hypothetical protein
MHTVARFALAIVGSLSMLAVTGCGDESSPTSPTPSASAPAAPTVNSIRIDGPDAVRTGMSSDYTATATLSNGTTQSVAPTWSSSNSSVAAVDGNGRVTGQSHGAATLTATHQGVSVTKPVSVVTNYGGQWSGRFVMRACDQSGVFAVIGYCQALGGVGSSGPVTLSLTQGGSDQGQVSGTISFGGSLTGAVSGNVTSDGRLVLGGSFNVTSSGVTFSFRVGGWESRLSGTSGMTGRWADDLAAVGVPGNVYTENEIVTMTRSSTSAMPASTSPLIFREWTDLFAAMGRGTTR